MVDKQKTIREKFSLAGVGLHTGQKIKLTFKPSAENTGIQFIREDLPNKPSIKADFFHVITNSGIPRCTSIGQDNVIIHTVEHLMSVLCGLEVDNLIVGIDGQEVPGLDGSGLEFSKAIKKVGLLEQNSPREYFYIKEPLAVEDNGSCISMTPATDFCIAYTLDYDHPILRSQFFSVRINSQTFEQEVAPCRTFCLESEAKELREKGLGKGANYENTLVVGSQGVINNRMRFSNEFARHKVLDFIGDIYLLGIPIKGHVLAVKSGHKLNLELLKKLHQQKEEHKENSYVPDYNFSDKRQIGIQEILKILPHRFPFLMVDRVYEIEKGKKGIGIKNVTTNDYFFQGHFPSRPVMPGVLIVEAMAQAAGVVVLSSDAHHGQIAFFMAADKVKFRKVVAPGDQIKMEVEVLRDRGKTAQVQAVAKVDGEIAAEAEMIFSFTNASYLD